MSDDDDIHHNSAAWCQVVDIVYACGLAVRALLSSHRLSWRVFGELIKVLKAGVGEKPKPQTWGPLDNEIFTQHQEAERLLHGTPGMYSYMLGTPEAYVVPWSTRIGLNAPN